MKDPLQKQPTPYEILGIGRDATAADIDKAFKAGLVKRVPVQKLTAAKVALERAADRAVLDALHYGDEVLGHLTPNPLADPSVLEPARRDETAAAWEAQLRRAFPDNGIIHALAVLWYWNAIDASESGSASAAESWRTAIGFWAALLASDDFPHAHAVSDRIAADIHRYAQANESLGKLELTLRNEVRVAKALAAADIRANRGKLTCGALMLERLGLVEKIRGQIENALQSNPNNASLISLRDALSPFSAIAALIESKQFQAALDEIEHLPDRSRDSKEVWKLEAAALFEKGKQEASLGNIEAALGLWAKALTKAASEETQRTIHDELVKEVQAKAAALQNRQPEDAIKLLERALKVVRSQKLELTLAEILTGRGISTILEAQKKAETEKKAGPEIVREIKRGLADLDRAVKLGSKRAEEQAGIAKNILAQLEGGVVVPDISSGASPLVQQAAAAAEKKEWTTAIDLLRRALDQASYNSEEARAIKKHLSTMLVNRAIGACNMVMSMMQSKSEKAPEDLQLFVTVVDAARKDLKEATELDPSSDYARENLRQVDEMLEGLGPLAGVARGAPSPRSSPFAKSKAVSRVAPSERAGWHAVLVGVLVVFTMMVALANQKPLWETKLSVWFTHTILSIRDGSTPGHIAYVLSKIIGWPAWLATIVMFIGSWIAVPGAYLYGVVCGTPWRMKDPFAKLVEVSLYAFVALFITGVVMKPAPAAKVVPAPKVAAKSGAPSPPPAARQTPAPAPAPQSRAPASPAVAAAEIPADFSPAGVVKTLQAIAASSSERAKQLATSFAATPSAAALFCAGAAYERAGDAEAAKQAYQKVVAADTAAFKRSAEFRLAVLDKSEERFRSWAAKKGDEGLFLFAGMWKQSDTQSAALQGMMDLRSEKKSIRLFNYLRAKSFFPPPYAYLFILLALALAIKVLSLPFLVHGAKASLAIPRLRGEYQRLKSQYSGDAVGFSSAITALYQRHGINPYAGCAKIFVDIGFVVWVMLTLKNYAPQLALDGSKFLWTSNVTDRDPGVLIMWIVAGMLMLFLTPQIEQGQTAQLACASLAILGIIAGAAWYWSWPAYLMIFWTVLSLLTAIVHFVTIGVLATRS